MNSWIKRLVVAVIVLAALCLALFYRQVPHSQKPFDNAAEVTTRIDLKQGSESIVLQKSGTDWTIASSSGNAYPADPEKMKSILTSLSNIQIEDQISDRADRAVDFEVTDASGTKIVTANAKGKTLGQGIFGKQAPDFSHLYFRYPDSNTVYLARGVFRGELGTPNPKEWRHKALIAIAETDMREITLSAAGRTLQLVRSSDSWTLDGKKINAGPVYGLIGTLAHLQADDFLDDTAGVKFDQATVTVKGEKAIATLVFGAADKKTNRVPVQLQGGPAYWIAPEKAKSLFIDPKSLSTPAIP